MKDRLKEFINEHRAEFDDREPSDNIWGLISKQLPGKHKTFFTSVSVWRAAAIIFFGLSMYLLVPQKHETSKLQGEFKDLEFFYNTQIAEKVKLIDNFNEYEDDQFTQDVQKLDAMYEVLREEMKTSPSVKVKDALILNILIRIDLLNQQIQKLEDHRKTDESQKEI